MSKVTTYFSITALFIAGYCLFAIKGEVQDISYRLNETSRQITEERNSINILKAEFAVLQSPERLRALANLHLNLISIKSDQITQDLLIESEGAGDLKDSRIVIASPNLKRNIQWRYKTQIDRINNRNNLKTVSHKGKKR